MHYHLVNSQALESSSIYQSARQSFFPDFFMGKSPNAGYWSVDINYQHFCHKNILYLHKSRKDIPTSPGLILKQTKDDIEIKISQNDILVKFATIHVELDTIFISKLKQMISNIHLKDDKPSSNVKSLIVDIPMIICEYKHHETTSALNEVCLCSDKDWKLIAEFKLIKMIKKEKVEINMTECDINVLREGETANIAKAFYIKFERQIQKENHEEVLEERKENSFMRYYIPGQGTVTIPKNTKATEPYSSIQEDPFIFEPLTRSMLQEDLSKGRASHLNIITSTKVELFLDPSCLLYLCSLFPASNNDQKSSDSKES